jgi:hypothetical protein
LAEEYRQFWRSLLDNQQLQSELPSKQEPPRVNWCGFGSGWGEAKYGVTFRNDGHVQVNICLNCKSAEATKALFDALARDRSQIETTFGEALVWDRRSEEMESWISVYHSGNISDQARLEEIRQWAINRSCPIRLAAPSDHIMCL